MNALLKSFIRFYIYSSFHISLAASLFVAEIYFLLGEELNADYILLVFFSTILVYSLHRLIGLSKMADKPSEGRFIYIFRIRHSIKIAAGISLVLAFLFLARLPFEMIIWFSIPAILSFLYIMPVLKKGKRVRDLPFIKIALISLAWAFLGILPLITFAPSNYSSMPIILLFLEKLVYIFLITIAFDVRDIHADMSMEVTTIANKLGIDKSYRLSYALLLLDGIIWVAILQFIPSEALLYVIPLILLISLVSLNLSKGKTSDMYYSGLLDGIIALRSLIIILVCAL